MNAQALTFSMVVMIIGSLTSLFVALGKSRGPIRWFVFGAVAPLFAITAVVCLPERTRISTKFG